MFKIGMVAAVIGTSLSLIGYQAMAVRSEPAPVDTHAQLKLDQVKQLADALTQTAPELPALAPEANQSNLPLPRRGGFIFASEGASHAHAASSVNRHLRPSASSVSIAPTPTQRKSVGSPFKKTPSALTTALRESFFTSTNFGFSDKTQLVHHGKVVRHVRSNGAR